MSSMFSIPVNFAFHSSALFQNERPSGVGIKLSLKLKLHVYNLDIKISY